MPKIKKLSNSKDKNLKFGKLNENDNSRQENSQNLENRINTTNANAKLQGMDKNLTQKTLLNYFLTSEQNIKNLVKNSNSNSSKENAQRLSASTLQQSPKLEQYQLDLNTYKSPSILTTCNTCSMNYIKVDSSDIKLHSKYHKLTVSNALKFPKSRQKGIEIELDSNLINGSEVKIISINYWLLKGQQLNKIKELIELIGEETGKVDNDEVRMNKSKIYLLLTTTKREILGFVIAEAIKSSYKIAYKSNQFTTTTQRNKAIVGIHRMWTNHNARGQGICSKLINCVKNSFCLRAVDRESVAFYEPTEAGLRAAKRSFECDVVYGYSDNDIA